MYSSRLILSLPLSLGVTTAAAQTPDATAVEEISDFRLTRQPLDQVLISFGIERGISVIFDRRLTDGKYAHPVDASLPPLAALDALLAETGLRYERVREGLWVVVREGQPLEPGSTEFSDIVVEDHSELYGGIRDVIIAAGTRIRRADLNATSPVITVNSEQLILTNTVNVEQFLNTLPQVVPSFGQASNNPGDGSARISLRGLGTARTLVLVDGGRYVGLDPTIVVDLNNIPSALVERIDIVTGGASAVYGSDAVAGVVNFILKKDFEGIQLDVSHELSAAGWDANTTNIAVMAGGNFADGRGNAVVFASYTNRDALRQGDRLFSSDTLFDLGPGATIFGSGGSSNVPETRFRGATSSNFNTAPETVDPLCGAGNSNNCFGFWNNGGSGAAGDIRGLRFTGAQTDLYNYAPDNYLQLPQERYNITTLASYEVNDHVEAYMRGVFSHTVIASQLAPAPTGAIPVTINIDNPAIPAALLALITSDAGSYSGGPTANIRFHRRFEELGTRNSLRTTNGFQILVGARGDLDDQWSYDTFLNFSRSTVSQIQTGNISNSAVQAAVLCDTGPTAAASGCTAPYLDIFGGAGGFSPASAAFVGRTGARFDETEQTQWVGTLSGDLEGFRSPFAASDVALVLGLEYRELFANSIPDSVLGPDVRGFNASLPVGGRYDVYEAFGEVQLPLITGKPFIESFTLNGAYRYSDYSVANVGGTHTFAAGGEWEVIPGMRFRAQFQRAVRAPNIAELFSAFTNGFPRAQDPCSAGFGSFSPSTLSSTCTATGVPMANVGASFQSSGEIQILTGGNPNLFQETGDTLTVGMVWQPQAIEGLTLQIDYYDISIKNAITMIPLQTVLNECHIENIADQCAIIGRGRDPATGELGALPFTSNLGAVNAGFVGTRGIDFDIGYSFGGLGGSITVQYYGTYIFANTFQSSATSRAIDCAGFFGPQICVGGIEPQPEYKHTAQITYLQGPMTTSLRWRALSGVDSTITGLSDLSDDIGFFNYIDVTTQYAVNEHLDLTVGVKNITGKDVPLLGSTVNEQANTYPVTYTPFGRQLFFGASLRF